MLRPTWAEVDLDAVAHNVREIRKYIGPQIKYMAVVKGDAYGHGAVPVAKAALKAGADQLAVATGDEAVILREAGIKDPILVLGTSIPGHGEEKLIELQIAIGVTNREFLLALNEAALRVGNKALAHIKLDTGMGRLGVPPKEAIDFIKEAKSLAGIEIAGVYTHFAMSDEEDKSFNQWQFKQFNEVMAQVEKEGIEIPLRHVCNSAAVVEQPNMYCNLVRAGTLMYGYYPSPHVRNALSLLPVMALKTRIVHIKDVRPGASFSYGLTYTAEKETKVATLPVGYGDGYRRIFSNRAYVLVRGQRASVVGRICMDQCMIDVGNIPDAALGDEVVLLGTQGEDEITVADWAALAETIPVDITVNIGKRVPRIYQGRV